MTIPDLGLVVSLTQFICACVNIGLLPASAKEPDEDDGCKAAHDRIPASPDLNASPPTRLRAARPSARPENAQVANHLTWMGLMVSFWVFLGTAMAPTSSSPTGQFVSSCATTGYKGIGCVALIAHLIFPFLDVAILVSAMFALYRRAVAVHGRAVVTLPPPPPRTKPAWTLAHVAELDVPAAGDSLLPPPPSSGMRMRTGGGRIEKEVGRFTGLSCRLHEDVSGSRFETVTPRFG
ncbi:hypothetical protein FB451DRAFT_1179947 [Mycena latifolia]|nr:hypothetical protein FB451DRAFT_1179947 [Mycena latifolia]